LVVEDRVAARERGKRPDRRMSDDDQAGPNHGSTPWMDKPPPLVAICGSAQNAAWGGVSLRAARGAVSRRTMPPTKAAPPAMAVIVDTFPLVIARSRRCTPSASQRSPLQ